jgi:hypothetical protein
VIGFTAEAPHRQPRTTRPPLPVPPTITTPSSATAGPRKQGPAVSRGFRRKPG